MKRMLSLLLALVMLLGVLPMATLAEETTAKPVVHLTADKESVLAGEEVTLTLALDGDISGSVAGWEWDFIYDSKYFAITGSTVGDAAQPLTEGVPDLVVTPLVRPDPELKWEVDTYRYASVTSGNSITPHYLRKGTIATLTLKAKEDIEEDISSKFYFVPVIVMNSSGTELDVVDADATTNWGYADFVDRKMPADTVGLSVTVKKPLEPIDITVYYADKSGIVTGKDGTQMNFAPVTVEDLNGDGKFTMYEGFIAMHEAYCADGAAGYEGEGGVTKFWGVQSADASYVHNHRWVYSPQEEIAEGDSISFFWYQDVDLYDYQNSYSDLYTYFDSLTAAATAGQGTTFHVNGYSVFGSGEIGGEMAHAIAAPEGATVTATCEGQDALTTTVDADGNFKLTFPAAGEWTVLVDGKCSYTATAGYYANKTYTDAPVVPAQMTVTVAESTTPPVNPDQPVVEAGYTVTMPGDKTAVAGETVQIAPVVGYTDETVTTYNAFDMSFTYDQTKLELTSTTIDGLTVIPGDGTVRVQGYGADKSVGTAPFTLTFKALTTGSSDVTLTSAKVDFSGNAIDKDAPEATISDASTTVGVGGYSVKLPENFTGAATAEPGKDYIFSEPEDYYDYDVKATVGGEDVTLTDNGDGSYTIKDEDVTGEIKVTATKNGKKFKVTLGTDMTGAKEAQYMTDYTATLTRRDGFTYDVSVTIDGKSYSCDVSGNSYTVKGEDITGDIVFAVTRKAQEGKTFSVTFEGSGKEDAEGNGYVTPGTSYSFKLNKAEGYDYEVTATMGGEPASYTEADGKYTFDQVTGNLVITITKTLHLEVTVSSYVELDDKTVALITATATLGQGQALSYDGTAMFWSDSYNAWSYLVIVEGQTLPTSTDVANKIVATETTYTTIEKTQDVNKSGVVDINDAQLVYDIYNGKYQDFNTVSMQKFLNADVSGDRIVNVNDAAAVVAVIQ